MRYTSTFLGTVFLILAGAAVINYIVDPGGIYHSGGINPQGYADALVRSERGLWKPDNAFDERLVAKALAKYARKVDCVVIGSSHVTLLGSARSTRALQGLCKNVLNLGVSGAGIEDHVVLAYLALTDGRPKKIIFGVDPWTLAFGKDLRWSTYRDDYLMATSVILGEKNIEYLRDDYEASVAKIVNLISLDYTIRSIQTAIRDLRFGVPVISAIFQLDTAVGGDYPAQLKDGSHVYSASYIAKAARAIIPAGGVAYKTDGLLNQQNAIEAYLGLLSWVKQLGVEPILLMTPYHENVWKAPLSDNAVALRKTEPIIMNLAKAANIKLLGSYNPEVVGCYSNEFYDFMHPTVDCLVKIKVRLLEKGE
jgi:hypothetical protein